MPKTDDTTTRTSPRCGIPPNVTFRSSDGVDIETNHQSGFGSFSAFPVSSEGRLQDDDLILRLMSAFSHPILVATRALRLTSLTTDQLLRAYQAADKYSHPTLLAACRMEFRDRGSVSPSEALHLLVRICNDSEAHHFSDIDLCQTLACKAARAQLGEDHEKLSLYDPMVRFQRAMEPLLSDYDRILSRAVSYSFYEVGPEGAMIGLFLHHARTRVIASRAEGVMFIEKLADVIGGFSLQYRDPAKWPAWVGELLELIDQFPEWTDFVHDH